MNTDDWSLDIKVDLRRALTGGLLAALVTAGGAYVVGRLSSAEARVLMETTLPRTQSLAGTVILACATIMALMLTLLGLSSGTDAKIKPSHYQRVRQIAFITAIVFAFAMVVNLILNVPIMESSKVSPRWYSSIYYISLGSASLMGGALISIVLMIYHTVRDLISVMGMDPGETTITVSEEEKKEREESA